MQKWVGDADTGHYEDVPGSKIYPGDTFTVLKSNSKIVIINSHTDEASGKEVIDEATYTLQLRAEYGPKEVETPTHIYWYANNETTGVQKDENIQINKGVDIPTTETWTNGNRDGSGLSYEGHEFLGWARLETTDTVDPATLCYDDLFLRWVGNHYEATNDSGAWVPVTQVACDERTPYHNMYAVWAKVFYVYHSGTNVVEKVVINNSTVTETNGTTARTPVTFNLAGRTSAGFLYGGYYTDYAGKGANFDAKLVAEASWTAGDAAAAASANARAIYTYTDSGTGVKAYDGPVVDTTNKSSVDPWHEATAYTVSGMSLVPEAGKTYYIKEVPETYLSGVVRYTYFKTTDNPIGSVFITCALDTDYNEVGIIITGKDGEKAISMNVVGVDATDIKIEPENGSEDDIKIYTAGRLLKKANTESNEDAAQELGKLYGKVAYVEVMNIKKAAVNNQRGKGNFLELIKGFETDEEINDDTPFDTAVMYWVTPDNIRVTGTVSRTYKGMYTEAQLKASVKNTGITSTLTYISETMAP